MSKRRLRLGTSHGGAPSHWVAPSKDPEPPRAAGGKPGKKKHR
ncbi:MAG: hypothetical protein R2939_00795 [Kofleriaceae bacterium]